MGIIPPNGTKPASVWAQKKGGKKSRPIFFELAIFVTLTEHIIECSNLALATFDFAGLFKVAFLADVSDDAFSVKLLLQAAKSLFHSLAFA